MFKDWTLTGAIRQKRGWFFTYIQVEEIKAVVIDDNYQGGWLFHQHERHMYRYRQATVKDLMQIKDIMHEGSIFLLLS